jgi:hypothetical protein
MTNYRGFMDSKEVKAFMMVITVISLFLFDLNLAFFPKESDIWVIIIVAICVAFFTIEIILNLSLRPKYICSFFFVLDIVGTISLLPDVLELQESLSSSVSSVAVGSIDLQVAVAGRAGK